MRLEVLLLYCILLYFVGVGFLEDFELISILYGNYIKQYLVFVGYKLGWNIIQRYRLDIQMIMIMNGIFYIVVRDYIYIVDIDILYMEEIYCSKKLIWKFRQVDVDICRMKGKYKDECYNFIKVFLKKNDDVLFVCGINVFNFFCRNYKMDMLELFGDEFSGMVRCLYDVKYVNVVLFVDGKLYLVIVIDFFVIDVVIYWSFGESFILWIVKYDLKWLKELYFV